MPIRFSRAYRRHALQRQRAKAFRIALDFTSKPGTDPIEQALDWARRRANHLLRCGCYLCTDFKRDFPSFADTRISHRMKSELREARFYSDVTELSNECTAELS